ncbi:hypothetical protein BLOT_014470 [Blomia tropicalis]|nr:hypothetical protein BLOT_014470 [Blomia tropicalis]
MDLEWLANQNMSNWTQFGIMEDRPDYEALPRRYHIYAILLYLMTASFTLIGNLIALVVLKNGKRTSRHLSKYLINLSCSDLLMATCIPFVYTNFMYGQWYFAPWLCPCMNAIQFYSVFVSVYTLVVIGIDRYIAIKTPIRSKTIDHLTNLIIFIIWLVGLCVSFLIYLVHETREIELRNEKIVVCAAILDKHEEMVSVTLMVCLIYLAPISILAYVYGSMAVVIFKRDLRSNSASKMLKRQRRKVIKIMMVVVIVFILCWSPLQLYNVLTIYFPQKFRSFSSDAELTRYVVTYMAFHLLAMAHSFVNPIVYSFMSQSFRFRKIPSSVQHGRSTSIRITDSVKT